MFRVDVYANEGGDKTGHKKHPPAYACLATASDDNLLTVGRKNATFLLDKDKSVSRDHLHVHLISEEYAEDAAVLAAKTPEDKEACDQNPLGLALNVENLGKFGTAFLAMAPVDGKDHDAAKKSSAGSDSGSDTEDESQKRDVAMSQDGSLPSIPNKEWFPKTQEISQKILKDKSYKIVASGKLEAKESKTIPGNATTIILQCGQQGSLLVLTKLDMLICKSNWPAASKTSGLRNQLYKIGAQLIEEEVEETLLGVHVKPYKDVLESPLPPSAYLVAAKRDTSPKQIVAWNLQIPFATLEFLQALLDRKTLQDPWPNHEEFDPPAKDTKGIDMTFWNNPTSTQLWKSCTFLSTVEKNTKAIEHLVRAAGGDVVQVYELADDEVKAQIEALLADPSKQGGVFCSATKGSKKVVKWIKDHSDPCIPHISGKKVTLALCQQELLHDDKEDRVIQGKIVEEKEPEKEPPKAKEETKPEESDSDSDATVDESQEIEKKAKEATKNSKRKADKRKADSLKEDEKVEEEEDVEEPTKSQTKRARKSKDKEDEDEDEEQEPSESQRRRTPRKKGKDELGEKQSQRSQSPSLSQRNSMEILPSVQEEDSMMAVDDSLVSEEPSPKSNKKRKTDDENEALEEEELVVKKKKKTTKERRRSPPGEPGSARLETTEDGWFVAAPKDSASRQAYLRPEEEIMNKLGEDADELTVAETVVCSGLVFRPYDPNRSIAGNQTQRRWKKSGGVDFKKFRKNEIVRGDCTIIQLKTVQPKESIRMRELQEQEKAIDAQQREGDELFAGLGSRQTKIKSTSTSRRRRKA